MKVLIDHNISPAIAAATDLLVPQEVVALWEKFPNDTPDVDWIRALSLEGDWIIISADRRILKSPAEKAVFRAAKITGFFLSRGVAKLRNPQKAARLLHLWDVFIAQAENVPPGCSFEIPVSGSRIKLLKYG